MEERGFTCNTLNNKEPKKGKKKNGGLFYSHNAGDTTC